MFEWDEAKNRTNREKARRVVRGYCDHGFAGPMLVAVDDRRSIDEARYIAIGFFRDVPVVIVYAERGEKIRIISARKADRHERQKFKEFLDQLAVRRLRSMPDQAIDYSDIPQLSDDFFRTARLLMPQSKGPVAIRLG